MSIKATKRRKELEEHGSRIPSIWQRYIRRAEFLRDHPPFRDDIERLRAEWDATWPEFAIGVSPIPAADLEVRLGAPFIPPRLLVGLDADNDAFQGRRPHLPNDSRHPSLAYSAWRHQFLNPFCTKWWPARYFPLYYSDHLARRFVSGCLLCTPKLLPDHAAEEWIGVPTMEPYTLPAPVQRMVNPARLAEWEGWAEALLARLNAAAETEEVLTTDLLTHMAEEAHEAGRKAAIACRDSLRDESHGHHVARMGYHWVVPLFPGMAKRDLTDGADQIMSHLDDVFGDMLREDARRLHREGKSARQIAGLMGVSEPAVGEWIKGLEHPSPG